jgi:hypothetical protein
MVFKDAKEFIQADIDRGWLDHRLFKRLDGDAAGRYFGSNIAITKKHGASLPLRA